MTDYSPRLNDFIAQFEYKAALSSEPVDEYIAADWAALDLSETMPGWKKIFEQDDVGVNKKFYYAAFKKGEERCIVKIYVFDHPGKNSAANSFLNEIDTVSIPEIPHRPTDVRIGTFSVQLKQPQSDFVLWHYRNMVVSIDAEHTALNLIPVAQAIQKHAAASVKIERK